MRNSLLPPHATPLMQRIEQACEKATTLPVPLRTLWDPGTCPPALLPYLAWALSVDSWDASWSTKAKRDAIRQAYFIHRRKGTISAIRRVIENMGYSVDIEEWWQIGDPPGTFRLELDVNNIGITEEAIKELERLIGDARPVSRHIAGLNIKTVTRGKIYSAVASYCGEILTVYPAGKTPDISLYYDGKIKHSGHYFYTGNASDE